MLLKRKIAASGMAEVVIALAIIATCIGIASLVFSRSIMSTTKFPTVRMQTEIQCQIWKHFQDGKEPEEPEMIQLETTSEDENEKVKLLQFRDTDGKIIWEQQSISNE